MTQTDPRNLRFAQCLMTEYQNSQTGRGNMQQSHRLLWDARNSSLKRSRVRVVSERACVTFTGDVVFAWCCETSAAVAVDGCYSELVPALRSQIGQNHIFRQGLQTQTHQMKQPAGA